MNNGRTGDLIPELGVDFRRDGAASSSVNLSTGDPGILCSVLLPQMDITLV